MRFPLAVACCGLIAAAFPFPAHALVISELHYHPSESTDPDGRLEFIELLNETSTPIDLSGYSFADGVHFVFPEGTLLGGNSYLVVCRDLERFRTVYGEEPALGNFDGRLNDSGERLQIANRVGAIVTQLRFGDRDAWTGGADGTGYSLTLVDTLPDPTLAAAWTRSVQLGGTPGRQNFPPPVALEHPVFPESDPTMLWRYRKGWDPDAQLPREFSDPPEAWTEEAFDDSVWLEGLTPIGFGSRFEFATVLDDMDRTYVSFAARSHFTVGEEHLAEAAFFLLHLGLDDGCVVFINGEEVARASVPGAPGERVPVESLATQTRNLDNPPLEFAIPNEKLRAGTNLLAIQVHNRFLRRSADAGFFVSLGYRTFETFPGPPKSPLSINEVASGPAVTDRFVEIFNSSPMSLDLSEFQLSLDPERRDTYVFPAGTRIEAQGFLSFSENVLNFSLAEETTRLFLSGRDENEVKDATTIEVDPTLTTPTSRARLPNGSRTWWTSTAPTPGTRNQVPREDGLVINEIHYHPRQVDASWRPDPDLEQAEFIELLNRSERNIPLNGFALTSGYNFAFTAGQGLGPGEYLVLARDPEYVRTQYGLDATQVIGPPPGASLGERADFGVLKNGGERVRLVDALGNTVDEVTYADRGDWSPLADAAGASLELVDPSQDNAVPMAWDARIPEGAAPWVEISYEAEFPNFLPPGAVASELHLLLVDAGECLIDGVSLTAGDPPVEYVPNGSFEDGIAPWRLWGTHGDSDLITDEAQSGRNSLLLAASGAGDTRVNRVEVDLLSRPPEGPIRVRLWARWLSGSNTLHISGHNNAFGHTFHLPVPTSSGTPGRENSVTAQLRETRGSANLGPMISDVWHSPAVPSAGERIGFRARVTDSDGVASARLRYRSGGEGEFLSEPLLRNGPLTSGLEGEGVFSTDVPGFPDGTLLGFYIETADDRGQEQVYPRGAPDETLMLVVDKAMSGPGRLRLVLSEANLNELDTRFLHSNAMVSATLIRAEKEIYYNVGTRYRGSPWGRASVPRQFRVRFRGEKPYVGGARSVNLNTRVGGQRARMAQRALERASLPNAIVPYSPQWQYIQLNVNGDPHNVTGAGGYLTMAEERSVDSQYVSFHWPDDNNGVLWKMTGRIAFNDMGARQETPAWTELKTQRDQPYPGTDSVENYRYFFNPKLRRDADEFGPMIEMVRLMDNRVTPEDVLAENIADVVNLDASLRTLAIRLFQDDWDTVDIGNGQNAFFYHAPLEGRNYLVPWDMDNTYGNSSARLLPLYTDKGFGRVLRLPHFRRQFERIVMELLEVSFSPEETDIWTNFVDTDLARQGLDVDSGASVSAFVRTRNSFVLSGLLQGALDLEFTITSPDPTGTFGNTGTIQGLAPLEVEQLLVSVNGSQFAVAEPRWFVPENTDRFGASPVAWEIDVNGLEAERNQVIVLAFDGDGNEVGADEVEVYNTSTWPAPTVASVEPTEGPDGGGTRLKVLGTGFGFGTRLQIGGTSANDLQQISDKELRGTVPAAEIGTVDVTVLLLDDREAVVPGGFTYVASTFRRGDLDGDGEARFEDVLTLLSGMFQRGALPCADAADVDDDGALSIVDALRLLNYLFQAGPAPAPPFDNVGADPTDDAFGCTFSL